MCQNLSSSRTKKRKREEDEAKETYIDEFLKILHKILANGCIGRLQTQDVLITRFDCLQFTLHVLELLLQSGNCKHYFFKHLQLQLELLKIKKDE